jgi:hypothetical protein
MSLADTTLSGEVHKIVSDFWKSEQKPLLFSKIGQLIGDESKDELKSLKLTLKSYISKNMIGVVRLIFVEPNLVYAAPSEATKSLSDQELVLRISSGAVSAPQHVVVPASSLLSSKPMRAVMHKRFYKEVWAAFSRPINSIRRYLELRDGAHPLLHEIGTNEIAAQNAIEIVSSDLPEFDPSTRRAAPADIADAIRAWARAQSIPLSKLYDNSENQEGTVGSSTQLERLSAAARMKLFLEALEPDEVSRVVIPSDIVLKILQRSGIK